MSKAEELKTSLIKLRSDLEDTRKQLIVLKDDGKSIASDGKPLTLEAIRAANKFNSIQNQIKIKELELKAATQTESRSNNDPVAVTLEKIKLNNAVQAASERKAKLETFGQLNSPEWNQANKVITDATDKLNSLTSPSAAINQLKELSPIKELPMQPDPELIKKEAMARAQKLKSDAEQLLQQKKEEELNKLKDKVEAAGGLLGKAAALYVKMPLIDPKFLAHMAYMEAKEKIQELKQKASKENLKKSKEAFTFPMKPPTRLDLGELPKLQLPKIPEIPKLPQLPKITLSDLKEKADNARKILSDDTTTVA